MELKAIPAEALRLVLAMAENDWERVKDTSKGREHRAEIKQALADAHLALQRPSL